MFYEDRECCECGTVFTPKVYNSLICENKSCYESLRGKRAKAKRKADREKKGKIKCGVCHDLFSPSSKIVKICKRPECQKEKTRLQSESDRKNRIARLVASGKYEAIKKELNKKKEKYKHKYKKIEEFSAEMVCSICKKTYISKSTKRITCYDKKCIRAHRNIYREENGLNEESRKKYKEKKQTKKGRDELIATGKRCYEATKLTGSYQRKNIVSCAIAKRKNNETVPLSVESGVYRTLWGNEEDLELFKLKESGFTVREISTILKRTISAVEARWGKIKNKEKI